MSSPAYESHVPYGTRRIAFRVVRTDRTTLGLRVHPDGTVEVRAPRDAPREAVAARVKKRARWIARQQRQFASFVHPPTSGKEYVAGETHRFLGCQYRLRPVPLDAAAREESVERRGRFLWIHTPAPHDSDGLRRLVCAWYARQAKTVLPKRFAAGRERMHPYGVGHPACIVQPMKKRWGSYTPEGRVLLNPELVHASPYGIDYVVIHELCHVLHPHHGPDFYTLLEKVLPDWRERKRQLEKVQP